MPPRWPVPEGEPRLVGFAGGLGPDTIADALARIATVLPANMPFWLDMEGAIHTEDRFDLAKCRAVLEIVEGGLGV